MTLSTAILAQALDRAGVRLIPSSVRELPDGSLLFAARRGPARLVGWVGEGASPVPEAERHMVDGHPVHLFPWDWTAYQALRGRLPALSPARCDRPASFGAGDRLGLATAAQLAALQRYPVFPVLAQQSPRELARTGRDFRGVLLDAAWGVLETGYGGPFGADADHLQDEAQVRAAAAAGYSLYTFDLRRALARGPRPPEALSALARSVIAELAGRRIAFPGGSHRLEEALLEAAACTYEGALEEVVRGAEVLRAMGIEADLEISVDETEAETPPEAHAFIAVYLQRRGIPLWSLAPRFPGVFEKAVDYEGEVENFARAAALHAAVARTFGGHRLSLHSGSEKFRILKVFREATGGHFHVKTSGTTWLQAVRVVARRRPDLFTVLYHTARVAFEESRRDYPIALRMEDLPPDPPQDPEAALEDRSIRQLFHISYGVLLDRHGMAIEEVLRAWEAEHEVAVSTNIERHLAALFGD